MINFFIGHSLNVLSLSNYEIFLVMNSNADIFIRKRELYPNSSLWGGKCFSYSVHSPGRLSMSWGYSESKEPTMLSLPKCTFLMYIFA